MTDKKSSSQSILSTIRNLEVGESCTFPAAKANYLKSLCSNFGFEWGKRFTTSNNRTDSTVTATRIK